MNDQSEVAATPGGEQDEFTELAGHGSLSLRVQSRLILPWWVVTTRWSTFWVLEGESMGSAPQPIRRLRADHRPARTLQTGVGIDSWH